MPIEENTSHAKVTQIFHWLICKNLIAFLAHDLYETGFESAHQLIARALDFLDLRGPLGLAQTLIFKRGVDFAPTQLGHAHVPTEVTQHALIHQFIR